MQETNGRRLKYLVNSKEIIMGVYKIENIKNHKVYIGSSKNIYNRWRQHLRQLKANNHHSIKLQRCYNKLKDKSTLQFSIVEIVNNESVLKNREQYYIDKYDAFNSGYNCSEQTDNPKYTLKNKRKTQRHKKAKQLYMEFDELYDENIFRIPPKILCRIQCKEYTDVGMRRIVCLMKLYLKYFSRFSFYCRIYLDMEQAYLEIREDKNDYILYKLKGKVAVAYFPVTKSDVKMMEYRTGYVRLLHTILKRIPILK